ncbi:tRNA (adenine-N1)-methyltransferase [soil metagenome]
MRERPLAAGERVLLVDSRGRRYLVTLAAGQQWHSHAGGLEHDSLIGAREGARVRTSSGARIVAIRPGLADYVLKMRRGAQLVYPKDTGLILVYADIFPGATVVEAGSGSGALTLALARAVGTEGRVISYEIRADHLERAVGNVDGWYRDVGGRPSGVTFRLGDVANGIEEKDVDRVVLDLPEPWRAMDAVTDSLVAGGALCCYLPTVPQVSQTVEAMRARGFGLVDAFEGLVRTWNVEGQSVRPDHRMVGHTGFIVVARKLGPDRG